MTGAAGTRHTFVRLGTLLAAIALGVAPGPAFASSPIVTHSHASAVARTINLRPGDLPTFQPSANPLTAQDKRDDAVFNTCAGAVQDSVALTISTSQNFGIYGSPTIPSTTVSDEVEILPSASLAQKDLAAQTTARGVSCANTELAALFRQSLAKHQTVTVHTALLRSPGFAALHTYELRSTALFRTTKGTTVQTSAWCGDQIGFSDGQLDVQLTDVEIGATPSSALEHRLLALLVSRTKAAVG